METNQDSVLERREQLLQLLSDFSLYGELEASARKALFQRLAELRWCYSK